MDTTTGTAIVVVLLPADGPTRQTSLTPASPSNPLDQYRALHPTLATINTCTPAQAHITLWHDSRTPPADLRLNLTASLLANHDIYGPALATTGTTTSLSNYQLFVIEATSLIGNLH